MQTKMVGSGNVPTGGDGEGRQEGQAGAGGWKVGDGPGRENMQGKRPELRQTWRVFRFLRPTSSVELDQSCGWKKLQGSEVWIVT